MISVQVNLALAVAPRHYKDKDKEAPPRRWAIETTQKVEHKASYRKEDLGREPLQSWQHSLSSWDR